MKLRRLLGMISAVRTCRSCVAGYAGNLLDAAESRRTQDAVLASILKWVIGGRNG